MFDKISHALEEKLETSPELSTFFQYYDALEHACLPYSTQDTTPPETTPGVICFLEKKTTPHITRRTEDTTPREVAQHRTSALRCKGPIAMLGV